MLLLTQKKSMTVTQMSNYIGVTKASLYHSIVQLVSDGLVSEPDIQVKKNYVEKYYRLNTLAFKAVDPYELQKRLNQGANAAEYKDLLEAFFTSFSLYFQIYANEIRNISSDKLQQVAKELKEEDMLLWVIDLDDEGYQHELKEIRTLLRKAASREKPKANNVPQRSEQFSEGNNRIFLVAIPGSLKRFAS